MVKMMVGVKSGEECCIFADFVLIKWTFEIFNFSWNNPTTLSEFDPYQKVAGVSRRLVVHHIRFFAKECLLTILFQNSDVHQQCCLLEVIIFSTLYVGHWSFDSGKRDYIRTFFLGSLGEYYFFPSLQHILSPPVQLKIQTNEQLFLFIKNKL